MNILQTTLNVDSRRATAARDRSPRNGSAAYEKLTQAGQDSAQALRESCQHSTSNFLLTAKQRMDLRERIALYGWLFRRVFMFFALSEKKRTTFSESLSLIHLRRMAIARA